ncbi:MULE domain-containing protein [Aphis craccivora]|uniref:MULE domain-containing protein n=1 Tax=Aphis craccivora TaxID=307492 RepID=A0A6G0Y012_APHCR|nr:MULE domain-containing protein [Aphis craccivora]
MEQVVQVDVLSEHNYVYLEGKFPIENHLIDHNYNAPTKDNSDIESDYDVIIENDDDEDENIEPSSNYDAGNQYLLKIIMYLICEKQRNKKVNEYCPATTIIENIHDPENRLRLQPGGDNHGAVERAIGRRANISHPAGSLGYTFQQAQHRCKRMINCRRPKIPETIPALIHSLNMPEHITYRTTLRETSSEFFQQALTVDGITIGVIFANLDMIAMFREELRAVTYAGCDGTFKNTPSSPKQFRRGSLMTFQIVYKNVSIVRYCRHKYNLVLDPIKTNPVAARVLRMVLALPHLPANRGNESCPNFCINDGFRAILDFAQQNIEVYQRMETFLIGYVQKFWLVQVGPELITVFASEIRTNNYLESFHNQLLRFFRMHPNIWDFIQKLRILENQYYVKMFQARKNLTIRDQTSRREYAVNTVLIRRAIEKLNEDNDILRCLRSMGQANADAKSVHLHRHSLHPTFFYIIIIYFTLFFQINIF